MRLTAADATFVRAVRNSAPFNALWDFALYGTWRSLGLRALWDFALSGISRPMALRALKDFNMNLCT